MPYKDKQRRTERARERRKENPDIHRNSDAKYKRTPKGQFAYLKTRAKARNIEVTLTEQEFLETRGQNCCYCNDPLPEVGYGLDRIDSVKGYTADNIVPCCGVCNRIKGDDLTHEEMVVAMKAILLYRK